VTVGDENVAVGSDDDIRGLIEGIRSVARNAGLAKRQQYFSVTAELENLVSFAVFSLPVGNPNVSCFLDGDTVRESEQTGTEAL